MTLFLSNLVLVTLKRHKETHLSFCLFLSLLSFAKKAFTHVYLPLSVVVVFVLWGGGAGAPPGMTEGATCIFTGAQLFLL